MADIRPDRLTTCQSERMSVVDMILELAVRSSVHLLSNPYSVIKSCITVV
jgi:hypothetical protein